MTAIALFALLGVYLAFIVAAVVTPPWRRRPAPADPLEIAQEVTVHTTAGDTIAGVLVERLPIGIILDAARYLDSEQPVPLGGRVYIENAKINFIQLGV